MARFLVAYGTVHGSTAEIAARIGARLTEAGFDTDVLHANLGIDLSKYDAVVFGSPIYAGTWTRDPAVMLIANRDRVEHLPIALFSVGMTDVKHPGRLQQEHDAWIEKAFVGEGMKLNVVSSGVFNGVFWRRNLPWWMRVIDGFLRVTPQGDCRQWDVIESWADETATALRNAIDNSRAEDDGPSEC